MGPPPPPSSAPASSVGAASYDIEDPPLVVGHPGPGRILTRTSIDRGMSVSVGIVSWGVYLPYWRLQRSAIGVTLGTPSGRGTRAVASYDEDTTTLGVEAARVALRGLEGDRPSDLVFST